MKNIFMLLLCMMNILILSAQNNPIFGGGNADGFDKINFAQANNNIFNGGSNDGWDKISFSQTVNNIFGGGNGDGWSNTNFAQAVNNIFNGGDGDGWDKTTFAQAVNNIFNGGNGDGWDKTSFAQPMNNIFFGGQGDGWANTYRPLGPLPVRFLYFDAIKNTPTSSLLKWETTEEINTNKFDVEQSNDAIVFNKIGTVKAAGNSTASKAYTFIDNNPTVGINYYRLKQIDNDGHFTYTPTRQVIFKDLNAGTVKYYPNPTNGILTIELADLNRNEIRVINISNAAGAIISQLKIAANAGNKMQIDLSKYAKAVYFVQVKTATINNTERIILK